MPYQASDQYLQTLIDTASPATLRLLLIEKAISVCDTISIMAGQELAEEHTLHLRDLLAELLSGVQKSDAEVTKQVSDLYVFLLQHLTRAELQDSRQEIADIKNVLLVERETWQLVVRQQQELTRPISTASSSGLAVPHLSGSAIPASGSFSFDA